MPWFAISGYLLGDRTKEFGGKGMSVSAMCAVVAGVISREMATEGKREDGKGERRRRGREETEGERGHGGGEMETEGGRWRRRGRGGRGG